MATRSRSTMTTCNAPCTSCAPPKMGLHPHTKAQLDSIGIIADRVVVRSAATQGNGCLNSTESMPYNNLPLKHKKWIWYPWKWPASQPQASWHLGHWETQPKPAILLPWSHFFTSLNPKWEVGLHTVRSEVTHSSIHSVIPGAGTFAVVRKIEAQSLRGEIKPTTSQGSLTMGYKHQHYAVECRKGTILCN